MELGNQSDRGKQDEQKILFMLRRMRYKLFSIPQKDLFWREQENVCVSLLHKLLRIFVGNIIISYTQHFVSCIYVYVCMIKTSWRYVVVVRLYILSV